MGDLQAAGSTKTERKQQHRSLVTQQKLLDAALEAFSENGFKGTSTRDIAERAGVHHPLITYHFKNKERLWRAAAGRIFREFNISLVKAMAEVENVDPKARAKAFVRTYVRYARNQPALHKIILQEASQQSDRLDWLVENHLRPLFNEVHKALVELQALGIAPRGNTAMLFNMIRVSAGGLIALQQELKGTSGIDLSDDAQIDELAELIIRVFFPGEAPREAWRDLRYCCIWAAIDSAIGAGPRPPISRPAGPCRRSSSSAARSPRSSSRRCRRCAGPRRPMYPMPLRASCRR